MKSDPALYSAELCYINDKIFYNSVFAASSRTATQDCVCCGFGLTFRIVTPILFGAAVLDGN